MKSCLKPIVSLMLGFSFLFVFACGDNNQSFDANNKKDFEFERTILLREMEEMSMGLPIDDLIIKHPQFNIPDLPYVHTVSEGAGSLTPQWYTEDYATRYQIFYRIGVAGGAVLYYTSYNSQQTAWPITGLSHENEYYVCIKALNNVNQGESCIAGDGDHTGWIGPYTPDPNNLPSPPVIINPVETNGTQIIVRWLKVEEANQYDIKFESPLGTPVYIEHDFPQPDLGTTVIFDVFHGNMDQTYYISVRSENENGEGIYGDVEEARPQLPEIELNHTEINFVCASGTTGSPVSLTINSSNHAILEWVAYVNDDTVAQMEVPLNGVSSDDDPRDITPVCSQDPGEYSTTIDIWDHRYEETIRAEVTVNLTVTDGWSHPSDLSDHISPGGQNSQSPQLAMDDSGNAIIVWDQYDSAGKRQIFKAEYRNDLWTLPGGLGDNISPNGTAAEFPNVAMDNNGNAIMSGFRKILPVTITFTRVNIETVLGHIQLISMII